MANTLKFGAGNWATKEGSTLAYNDENNNYKPLPFNFSRASKATVINKDGLIETVGSGEPRIDFKDNTKGSLLLEPQRVNIFDYSSDLSAWSKLNSTVTESSVLSLDGVNNSYAYEKTSSSTSYIYRTVSLSNTTDYTLSFFVKSGTSTNVRTDIWDTVQSTQCSIQVDLVTKSVSNFIGTSYKIEDYTNGWMRISVTFTSESSFGTTFNRYFNDDSIGTELYIWGAQIEQGSYATSYIPTSGSTVQRQADVANGSGNSEVFNDSEGVLFADISALADDLTNRGITISDGSVNNRVTMFFTNVSNAIQVKVVVGGSNSLNSYIAISNISLHNKFALKYKQNDFSLFVNGFELITDTSGITFSNGTLTELAFDRGDGGEDFYGKTKEIGYYDATLTDSELEYLTSYRSLNELVTELNLNTL